MQVLLKDGSWHEGERPSPGTQDVLCKGRVSPGLHARGGGGGSPWREQEGPGAPRQAQQDDQRLCVSGRAPLQGTPRGSGRRRSPAGGMCRPPVLEEQLSKQGPSQTPVFHVQRDGHRAGKQFMESRGRDQPSPSGQEPTAVTCRLSPRTRPSLDSMCKASREHSS